MQPGSDTESGSRESREVEYPFRTEGLAWSRLADWLLMFLIVAAGASCLFAVTVFWWFAYREEWSTALLLCPLSFLISLGHVVVFCRVRDLSQRTASIIPPRIPPYLPEADLIKRLQGVVAHVNAFAGISTRFLDLWGYLEAQRDEQDLPLMLFGPGRDIPLHYKTISEMDALVIYGPVPISGEPPRFLGLRFIQDSREARLIQNESDDTWVHHEEIEGQWRLRLPFSYVVHPASGRANTST